MFVPRVFVRSSPCARLPNSLFLVPLSKFSSSMDRAGTSCSSYLFRPCQDALPVHKILYVRVIIGFSVWQQIIGRQKHLRHPDIHVYTVVCALSYEVNSLL